MNPILASLFLLAEVNILSIPGLVILLLILALVGACMAKWGAAPMILAIVATLLLAIHLLVGS